MLFDTNAWESPAFLKSLKRSNFVTSDYDVFGEEANEFPDNDRSKRTKLGRGSGQWRFADRTPSPEKQAEAVTLEAANSDVALGTRDVDFTSNLNEPLGPELAQVGEAALLIHHHLQDTKAMENSTPEIAPPSPPSTIADISENQGPQQPLQEEEAATGSHPSVSSEADISEREGRQQDPQEVPAVTGSPSSVFSKAISSRSDQRSTSSYEDRSDVGDTDGALFSGSTSDYGLDGSVFSRAKKILEAPPLIDKTVDQHNQITADTEIDGSLKADTISSSIYERNTRSESEIAGSVTVDETAHDFHFLDEQLSTQTNSSKYEELVATQLESNLLSESESSQNDNWEDKSPTEVSEIVSDVESHSPAESTMRDDRSNFDEADLDELLSNEDPRHKPFMDTVEDSQNADPRIPLDEGSAVDEESDIEPFIKSRPPDEIEPAKETPEPSVDEAVRPNELKTKTVEIINLESDDEEEECREQPRPVSFDVPPPAFLDGLVKGSPKLQPSNPIPAELELKEEDSTLNTTDSLSMEKGKEETPKTDIDAVQASKEGSASSQPRDVSPAHGVQESSAQISSTETSPKSLPGIATEELPRSLTKEEVQDVEEPQTLTHSSAATVASKPKPEVDVDQTAQDSFVPLPSTVPDSIQPPSMKSQLLTPDTTQQISFAPQSFLNSMQSPSTDEPLPTPQLTQGNSIIASTAPSSQPEESLLVEDITDSKKSDLDSINKSEGESLLKAQKAPTLVEKLKAMRRLSIHTPHRMRETNTASPWFVAKRSSQIVPDSEPESEVEVASENNQRFRKISAPVEIRTPEKQKLLAKSFIRSPSQQENTASMASSPRYLPPSQAPPPGFRTTLSYFVPLTTLQSHFALSIDVLATVVTATDVTRATSGPRDYTQSIFVTDPSSFSSRNPITTAQIFRSHRDSFPIIEQGDALLLRDFKVQSFQRRLSLLSAQSSAWACFRQHSDVQIRGPPLEFGPEERGFARGLWRWWDGLSSEEKHNLYLALPKDREKKLISVLQSVEAEKNGSPPNNNNIKNEVIQGLGVDLPDSQSKKNKSSHKERSLGLDGVTESTKPATRVLRPRGA